MSRDAEAKNLRLYDRRTIERNIKKGLITRKDYEKFLKTLDDAKDKGVMGTEIPEVEDRSRTTRSKEPTTTSTRTRPTTWPPRATRRRPARTRTRKRASGLQSSGLEGSVSDSHWRGLCLTFPPMGTSDSKQGGFTVTDRRSFAGAEAGKTENAAPPAPDDQELESGSEPSDSRRGRESTLPAVDFHTFVLSLGSSALLHLGELEQPEGGAAEKDLPLAKHTIDILSMLEEKTKGNLTSAEEKLIQSLLYDLRLRYVNASK